MNVHLVLGGPGAGKTHRLLEIMETELSNGVKAHQIAFVSFTRKAVTEAKTRAMKKFGLREKELLFFRTLHSLCYRQLGIRPSMVLSRRDLKAIGLSLGIPISGYLETDEGDLTTIGDRMLFLDNLARSTLQSLEDVWNDSHVQDVSWYRLQQFADTLEQYKKAKGLIDFTDMLTKFISEGESIGVRVAIIDESQDLTPAQWRVVDLAFGDCERMYLAGDDDQAIYAWSGADINQFLALRFDKKEVLPKSHRIPSTVFNIAAGIAERIERRYEKKWRSRDAKGCVRFVSRPSDIDLNSETWYLLARNRCFLSVLEEECVRQGFPYTTRFGSSIDPRDVKAIRLYEAAREGTLLSVKEATLVTEKLGIRTPLEEGRSYGVNDLVSSGRIWHDEFNGVPPSKIAYYLNILRRGRKLTTPPLIHIDTIHGVKGGEANNVMVMMDQTARTEAGSIRRPDDEARVFYVGMTRARENLFIVSPQTDRYYPI